MLPLPHWPTAARTLFRTFGVRGLAYRMFHEGRRAGGVFRARPRYVPASHAPPAAGPFAVDPARLAQATDWDAALRRAERVLAGEYEAYRWEWRPFPADAEGWLRNPLTGEEYSPGVPWWKVAHLGGGGDIKDVWEPGRFGWVYDLVRGYLLTRDDRFASAFHQRFGDWLRTSPPFFGPHWACGQETAIRAVALLYAEANLAGAPSSTPAALSRITRVLAASGERIADALGYALSQRNNHGISEAAGLVLIGSRLRGTHPEAGRWLSRGARWLDRLVREQFAEDGWYIQHSFTYLRLALDQCVLASRVLSAADSGLTSSALERLRAAVRLLLAVIDGPTGIVPNHGASDGAFVHPATLAGYRDFRPVVTAACAVFGVALPEDVAADPEVLAWTGLDLPSRAPARGEGVRTGTSGWAAARVGGTSVFLRAGRYTARPGHLDPLQLDVRIQGEEVVLDAGTFAYNGPAPWKNGLTGAAVHNGPLLDGREPGIRGPRFLWYLWPSARLLDCREEGGTVQILAERPGEVRREVSVSAEEVVVVDTALNPKARRLSARWLLHPDADPSWISGSGERVVLEAAEGAVDGWFSPRYGERIPSRVVEHVADVRSGRRVVTRILRNPVAREAVCAERGGGPR
jgi:hypothetical protein